jgi:hypothetical protein
MMIDEINNGPKKNRVSFTASGRRIYQTTFTVNDVLPALLLEKKWLTTF